MEIRCEVCAPVVEEDRRSSAAPPPGSGPGPRSGYGAGEVAGRRRRGVHSTGGGYPNNAEVYFGKIGTEQQLEAAKEHIERGLANAYAL
ncbi:unnamed protein product [Pleuronectes platessa]|uniref:Uncharacterized protein n=1 Tax=Pleuronectes platessa TaxID=8262 RepID=A0A9N7Z2T0_PLEPL|nr:unnamed protein product [Pleuronectes platessa]